MNLGNAILILYLLFYLKDEVHLSADAAEDAVFTLTAVYGLVTVLTAFVGGWWSDRVGKRKVFVIWSGLIAASALVLFAFVHTMAGRLRRRGGARHRLRRLHRGRLRADHPGAARARPTGPRTSG